MESGKRTKMGYECFFGGWLRRSTEWVLELHTAFIGPEIESPKMEMWAAASSQETSNLEMEQVGTVARPAKEMSVTTVRSALQTITNTSELQNLSLGPAEAADRIQELEDEIWEKEKCIEKIIDHITSQLMQFNKDIQANDKIINELKKKLNIQGTDDGVEDKSLTRTSQFDVLRVLGTGGFGTVYLVRKKGSADDGRLYAMKVLEKASVVQENITEYAIIERQVLEAVRHHPFLNTLHYAFQTDSKLYLVLEYMDGGDLLTHFYGRKLPDDDVRFYIAETILALEHLHKLGIIHRDVKLENILLDLQGHVVLSDFGLSRMFLPHEKHQAYSRCGTLKYMAPELIDRSGRGYDMAVDWWSLGIVTYQLFTGVSPFERRRESETDEEIIHRINATEPNIKDDLSFDAADFISKLLVKDPRKRLGGGKDDADELKRHSFLKGMNWCDLAQKKIRPPFAPKKRKEFDVNKCPDEFTKKVFADLTASLPSNCDSIFMGYSYVAPSVVHSEYAVSDELFQSTVELPEISISYNL
jgi:ribosomal protein S6 kinase alpha-5